MLPKYEWFNDMFIVYFCYLWTTLWLCSAKVLYQTNVYLILLSESGPSTSGRALPTSASEGAPHYAEADIISLQESSDSITCSITAADMNLFAGADSSMREFPRHKLTFKEKLGEGQFGEVYSVLQLQCWHWFGVLEIY